MKKNLVVLAISLLASTGSVNAATIASLYNTGVGNSGLLAAGQTDSHYTLINNGTYGPVAATGAAIAENSTAGWPYNGTWIGDNSTSAWLIPASNSQATGYFDYRTSFDLTGLLAGSAQILGQWSTDNPGIDILLNGISLGLTNTNQFGSWTAFSINSGFVAGINTLDFIIRNDGGPTGLRTEMTGTANLARVPEPASIALLAAGLFGFAATRKKMAYV